MAKYKVGDKVIVRKDLIQGKTYHMENRRYHDSATSSMCEFAGKIVTISYADNVYGIEETGWTWTDEMFEGFATETENTTKEIRLEGLMAFKIKDYKVINNKVVVVEFTDGDVQKAVCMPEDEFSLDQGIEVCVMKHICGGKAKYYKVLKEAQKQIIKLDETAKKKAEEENRLAQKQEKDNAKRAARRERARQARIAEQKEAYLLALKEYNGDVNKVVEAVESEN